MSRSQPQFHFTAPAPKRPARPPIARMVPPEGSALCYAGGSIYIRHDWNARGVCKRCAETLNKP